jgi:hypothetical protein
MGLKNKIKAKQIKSNQIFPTHNTLFSTQLWGWVGWFGRRKYLGQNSFNIVP